MKTQHVKQAFNKAAHFYNNACQLQLMTGKNLLALVKQHSGNHENILDAGCGTGVTTEYLASAFDYKKFYAIDIADQCINLAKKKLSPFKIHVEQWDFNEMDGIADVFDIIYSNLSLHWSENFSATLRNLQTKLQPNGIIAFSVPLLGTFKEIKETFSIHAFRTFEGITQLIQAIGFEIIATEQKNILFEFENIFTALKSIKSTGTNYVSREHRKSQLFKHIKKTIQQKHSVNLTYSIGYFIIKKVSA